MKRPSFQFYPADWRKDAALQSCSLAAQGMWINAVCVAHECEPYGHLTINGQAMTAAQLGRLVGASAKEAQALIDELLAAGVASRTAVGAIFSRRMVRDEDIRNRRAEGGKAGSEHGAKGGEHGSKGGRPSGGRGVSKPPSEPPSGPLVEPPIKPPPSSSSSSSSSPSGKKPPVPAGTAPPVDRPPDVADEHWQAWLAVRRAKRAGPVTAVALAGVQREADKAGVTVDDAVRICVERSWVGFNADWARGPTARVSPIAAEIAARHKLESDFMAELTGRAPPLDDRTIDASPTDIRRIA
jgi:hypothetical protein